MATTRPIDISFSMMVDGGRPPDPGGRRSVNGGRPPPDNNDKNKIAELSRSPPSEQFSIIQARQRSTWVDDNIIRNCFTCGTHFGWYIRSHHCRKCGNVFCYKCSNNWLKIPKQLGRVPKEPTIAQSPNSFGAPKRSASAIPAKPKLNQSKMNNSFFKYSTTSP